MGEYFFEHKDTLRSFEHPEQYFEHQKPNEEKGTYECNKHRFINKHVEEHDWVHAVAFESID